MREEIRHPSEEDGIENGVEGYTHLEAFKFKSDDWEALKK